MKLSLSIESDDPPVVAQAQWPSANFITQIAAALLRISQPRARRQRQPQHAIDAYGVKIRIGSEGRGKLLSKRI